MKTCFTRAAMRFGKSYKSFHYYLKQTAEPDKVTQIMLVIKPVKIGEPRIRVYTHLKVAPAYWIPGEELCSESRLLSLRLRQELGGINAQLCAIRESIESLDVSLAESGIYLNADDVRKEVDAATGHRSPAATASSARAGRKPVDVLTNLADSHCRTICKSGLTGSEAARRSYLDACGRLACFLRESRYRLRTLDDCGKNFLDSFFRWLQNRSYSRGKTPRKYAASTVAQTMVIVRNLIGKAYALGMHTNTDFRDYELPVGNRADADKVFLNEEELRLLASAEVRTKLERMVRDMFILSAYTALRISDINRLDQADVQEQRLVLFQKKTGMKVTVPLLKEVAGIARKYGRSAEGFPRFSDASANVILKRLAGRCGLVAPVTVQECRGGALSIRTVPKNELITFHTARRSCITNLYLRGYSVNHLMSLSGHRSIRSFQRYVRSSVEDVSLEFMKELKRRHAL